MSRWESWWIFARIAPFSSLIGRRVTYQERVKWRRLHWRSTTSSRSSEAPRYKAIYTINNMIPDVLYNMIWISCWSMMNYGTPAIYRHEPYMLASFDCCLSIYFFHIFVSTHEVCIRSTQDVGHHRPWYVATWLPSEIIRNVKYRAEKLVSQNRANQNTLASQKIRINIIGSCSISHPDCFVIIYVSSWHIYCKAVFEEILYVRWVMSWRPSRYLHDQYRVASWKSAHWTPPPLPTSPPTIALFCTAIFQSRYPPFAKFHSNAPFFP